MKLIRMAPPIMGKKIIITNAMVTENFTTPTAVFTRASGKTIKWMGRGFYTTLPEGSPTMANDGEECLMDREFYTMKK